MDHNYINKADLIDRYIMGRLPEKESSSFEEHFVDCPQCLAELKTTERFLDQLRLATIHDASQTSSPSSPSSHGWAEPVKSVRQMFGGKLLGIAATVAALVFLTAVLATFEVFRLRSELRQTNNMSAQLQSKYDEQQKSTAES